MSNLVGGSLGAGAGGISAAFGRVLFRAVPPNFRFNETPVGESVSVTGVEDDLSNKVAFAVAFADFFSRCGEVDPCDFVFLFHNFFWWIIKLGFAG